MVRTRHIPHLPPTDRTNLSPNCFSAIYLFVCGNCDPLHSIHRPAQSLMKSAIEIHISGLEEQCGNSRNSSQSCRAPCSSELPSTSLLSSIRRGCSVEWKSLPRNSRRVIVEPLYAGDLCSRGSGVICGSVAQ